MRPSSPARNIFLLAAVVACLCPSAAYAYIDPGTGSFVIQGVIAAVVGTGVVLKMFWGRIKAAITGKAPRDDDGDDD